VTLRELFVPMTALLLGACASVPPPATRSPLSPANPAAPEAVAPPAVPFLTAGDDAAPQPVPAPPKTEMDMHEGHVLPPPASSPTPETAEYTCPMHPAVTADKPGSCPVCGMALVEKKPARPEGGGSR